MTQEAALRHACATEGFRDAAETEEVSRWALAEIEHLRDELARAIETRENANTVSVRVEAENRRLRESLRILLAFGEKLTRSEHEVERLIGCCVCESARVVEGSP